MDKRSLRNLSEAELADEFGEAHDEFTAAEARRDAAREEILRRKLSNLRGTLYAVDVQENVRDALDVLALRAVLSPTSIAQYTVQIPSKTVKPRKLSARVMSPQGTQVAIASPARLTINTRHHQEELGCLHRSSGVHRY